MDGKEESYGCFAADLLCKEEAESLSLSDCNGGSESELPLLSDECFCWMVKRENEYLPRNDYLRRLRCGEIDLSLRNEALDWMLKACVHHNFGDLCLYSAMNYFDRFVSVYDLQAGKPWTAHLLAVACLLLASKVDEVNVPNTVDLQTGESTPRFLFEARIVERMEKILLNNLKWNIKPYTPLNFLEYFYSKINNNELPQQTWISRSIQIVNSTIKVIDFLDFRPSEIAAALAIFITREMRDVAIEGESLSCLIEEGKVMKCLELIQDLVSSSGSLSCSPNGVLEAASWSYRNGVPNLKRRKLDMNNLTTIQSGDPRNCFFEL